MKTVRTIAAVAAALWTLASVPALAQTGGGSGTGPQDSMTSGAEDLIIPAVVRGTGRLDSPFVTDLWIRAGGTGTATLSFHLADSMDSAPFATATVRLTQEVTYLPDVLLYNLGLFTGFGVIRVSAGFPISATVRVYSRSEAGAYGLSFMGMPGRMALGSIPMSGTHGMDEYAIFMLGLMPEPGNRVNVTVVSTSVDGASGAVDLVDSDGSTPIGSGSKSLPFGLAGYSLHQFNDVLANVHSKFAAGDAGLQVRVRMTMGTSGTVMAYAVVNDNVTNDGYVVVGTVMNGGRGMGGGSALQQ